MHLEKYKIIKIRDCHVNKGAHILLFEQLF